MFFFAVIGLFSFAMFLCLIYSIPILFVKQFRHRRHMLTLNICLIILFFGIIHILYLTTRLYYSKLLSNNIFCNLITYFRVMITFQMAFALVIVSIHRLCCVVYHSKVFFNTKEWLIVCIVSQWLIGLVLPLVFLKSNGPVRIFLLPKIFVY